MAAGRYRIGVDIGGTFTDVVVLDEADGSVDVVKVPTSAGRPVRGFPRRADGGARRLLHRAGGDRLRGARHTIATNTIIQGQGARGGLITSAGFSDVLEIAYQTRPTLYDIFYDKPAPLVPLHVASACRSGSARTARC